METVSDYISLIEGASRGKSVRDEIIDALEYLTTLNLPATSLGGHFISEYILKSEYFSDVYFDTAPTEHSIKAVTSDGLYSIFTPYQNTLYDINMEDVDEVDTRMILVSEIRINGVGEIFEGETTQLKATVLPFYATIKSFTWQSTDEEIATIDKYGFVKGIKRGRVIIKALSKDGSRTYGEFLLRVRVPTLIESIVLTLPMNTTQNVSIDDTDFYIIASITPAEADDYSLTWYSSDESILTVDEKGYITPVSLGSAYVYCISNDGSEIESNWIELNVIDPSIRLTIFDDIYDVKVKSGTEVIVNAEVYPEYFASKVKWSFAATSASVSRFDVSGSTLTVVPNFYEKSNIGHIEVMATLGKVTKLISIYELANYLEEINIWSDLGDEVSVPANQTTRISVYLVSYSPSDTIETEIKWNATNDSRASRVVWNSTDTAEFDLNGPAGSEVFIYAQGFFLVSNLIHVTFV